MAYSLHQLVPLVILGTTRFFLGGVIEGNAEEIEGNDGKRRSKSRSQIELGKGGVKEDRGKYNTTEVLSYRKAG